MTATAGVDLDTGLGTALHGGGNAVGVAGVDESGRLPVKTR